MSSLYADIDSESSSKKPINASIKPLELVKEEIVIEKKTIKKKPFALLPRALTTQPISRFSSSSSSSLSSSSLSPLRDNKAHKPVITRAVKRVLPLVSVSSVSVPVSKEDPQIEEVSSDEDDLLILNDPNIYDPSRPNSYETYCYRKEQEEKNKVFQEKLIEMEKKRPKGINGIKLDLDMSADEVYARRLELSKMRRNR